MNADILAKKITAFINWMIGSPLGFLLWLTAAVTIVGLGFGTINTLARGAFILPTFGMTPPTAIYTAGIVYLLHGKV